MRSKNSESTTYTARKRILPIGFPLLVDAEELAALAKLAEVVAAKRAASHSM